MNRNMWIAVAVLVAVLLAKFWPGLLIELIQRPIMVVVSALMPFLPLVLMLMIVYGVITGMLGSVFRGGRRGGRR